MPDLIRHPELIEFTGFRLTVIPDPDPGRNDKYGVKRTFYEAVNIYANRDLPDGFIMIDSHDLSFPMPDKQGTVGFEFNTLEKISEGKAHIIVEHVSLDGKYQLRAWQLWNSRFRMDIFTPYRVRICVTSEPITIKSNKNYSFVGTWSKNKACIYLNKKTNRIKKILE